MKSKIQQLEEEIHEQCVLNGKRENKRLRTALAFISATLSEDSDMSQAECMEKSYDYAYAALYPKNVL